MDGIAPLEEQEEEDFGALWGTVGKGISLLAKAGLKRDFFPRVIRHKETRRRVVQSWNAGGIVSLDQTLEDWARLYYDDFGIQIDLSRLVVPQYRYGFSRIIVVAQGITPNQVYSVCEKKFPCWRYTEDLDAAVKEGNDREPLQDYAVWFRERMEADEELQNFSARALDSQDIFGITLLERLLYELKFFGETGDHLDADNMTLCSGSRGPDGEVPCVFWRQKFQIDLASIFDVEADLRSRQASF